MLSEIKSERWLVGSDQLESNLSNFEKIINSYPEQEFFKQCN